jgi:hypothetical protein
VTGIVATAARIVLGSYLLLWVSLVSESALTIPVLPRGLSYGSGPITIEVDLLLIGLVLFAATRLERIRVWEILLTIGFCATLLSGLHMVGTSPPANSCGVYFSNYGFPFSWYNIPMYYQTLAGPHCLHPFLVGPMLDGTSLLLDTFFYTSALLGALEVFQGLRLLYFRFGSLSRS